jgi:hypothetical protein
MLTEALDDRADFDALRLGGQRERERAEMGAGAQGARAAGQAQRAGGAGVVLHGDEEEAGDNEHGNGGFEAQREREAGGERGEEGGEISGGGHGRERQRREIRGLRGP